MCASRTVILNTGSMRRPTTINVTRYICVFITISSNVSCGESFCSGFTGSEQNY